MEYLLWLYFFLIIISLKLKLPGLNLELHCFAKLNTFVTRRDRICRLVMVDRNSPAVVFSFGGGGLPFFFFFCDPLLRCHSCS